MATGEIKGEAPLDSRGDGMRGLSCRGSVDCGQTALVAVHDVLAQARAETAAAHSFVGTRRCLSVHN